MSKQEETYLTPEGKERLKTELVDLVGPQREALAKRLRSAIEMGDLSENADYHKAKEDQAFLEGRIQELKYIIGNAIVIEDDGKPKDKVIVGAHVTIQEDDYPPETYHLVGAKEADPQNGKISHVSPIGSALLDHRVGEIVEAEAPGGTIKFKILKIK
ncbi:MAG: transcription elongation factor GreA [Anaerolineae bacterium]|jgi:transcription elongation factor GreA|nr:transcription elongation factor GreA [Anaerolineae bacterium]MBT7070661.1 transcription elongation factor GreA [Anaerolineae bacterium]MBT7326289.1 transcription elongation factor GreA [Anaerolineae bacterium]